MGAGVLHHRRRRVGIRALEQCAAPLENEPGFSIQQPDSVEHNGLGAGMVERTGYADLLARHAPDRDRRGSGTGKVGKDFGSSPGGGGLIGTTGGIQKRGWKSRL